MTLQTFGLTAEQLLERKTGIGGSDANVIMSGDDARIMQRWLEFTNQVEPEDLSKVLPVQMGTWTEPLNRHWYTLTTGNDVTRVGEVVRSQLHPFMRCSLDGFVPAEGAIFEAKHVNAFAKPEEVAQKYMAQLHHNMSVCGVSRAVLSIFLGTLKHEVFIVEMDPFYTATMIDAEAYFWNCVQTMTPPGEIKIEAAPSPPALLRTVDMTGNNHWAAIACGWLDNRDAHKEFVAAEKLIKEAVEFDVGEASGHGICVKRSKAGALSIREMKNA